MGILVHKESAMKYVEKCPRCGGAVQEQRVTEILAGGTDTAFVETPAGVCLDCGERLFTAQTARRLEEIADKLKRRQTQDFAAVGKASQVAVP